MLQSTGMLTATPTDPHNVNAITQQQRMEQLLTLVGSAISIVALLFAMILYGHHKHLQTLANHLFILVLVVDLISAVKLFFCIFAVDEDDRYGRTTCDACGFIEQAYSFSEPCLMLLFWSYIAMILNGRGRIFDKICQWSATTGTVIGTAVLIFIVAIVSAAVALQQNMYSSDNQAWCWIGKDYLWFRIVFCWAWLGIAFCVSVYALGKPLIVASDILTPMQRTVLWRRATLVLVWFVINATNIVSRYVGTSGWNYVQALLNPLTGAANVLAFLYSERMMTLRAIGLAAGENPPYGFTAAINDLPERLQLLDDSERERLAD